MTEPQGHLTEEQIAAALMKTRGNMAAAGRRLNVTRATISQRVKASPALQNIKVEALEAVLDQAEDNLIVAVNRREEWATKYILDTQGKGRGYTRRADVQLTGQLAVNFTDADYGMA